MISPAIIAASDAEASCIAIFYRGLFLGWVMRRPVARMDGDLFNALPARGRPTTQTFLTYTDAAMALADRFLCSPARLH